MKPRCLAHLLISLLAGLPAWAAGPIAAGFTRYEVDTAKQHLALFWQDAAGKPYSDFRRLQAVLTAQGATLRFAMNAGMYHADFAPVGLLVMDGKERSPLNLSEGRGNFFMKPNGVFLLTAAGPQVVEASSYPALAKKVTIATQSGPMLVLHGVIHPAFNPASTSRLIRNGVGICKGKAVFAISEQPVNFHEMASYFRDTLGCSDALYLDGTVSSLYLPAQGRNDRKAPLGPIIGVVEHSAP